MLTTWKTHKKLESKREKNLINHTQKCLLEWISLLISHVIHNSLFTMRALEKTSLEVVSCTLILSIFFFSLFPSFFKSENTVKDRGSNMSNMVNYPKAKAWSSRKSLKKFWRSFGFYMPNSLEWHLYWLLSWLVHLSTFDICIASCIIMVCFEKSF